MEIAHNLSAHEKRLAAFLRAQGDCTDKMILALEMLLQEGKIRKSEESGQYLAPGIQTDWERVDAVVAAYRESGKLLTFSALAREVGIKGGVAGVYLRRAEARGLAERIGRGAYRYI